LLNMTPYPDVNAMLDLVRSRIQAVLRTRLVGLYLYGSLVTGDFDPDRSDLDLLAVISSELDQNELAALGAMHQDIARDEKRWDNRLEVAYLSTNALRTFKSETSPIAIISPGEPFHRKTADKDWLINWYYAREQGLTLFGPSPKLLIEPISHEEVLLWLRDHLRSWPELIGKFRTRNGQVYATLTMCRALYTFNTGGLNSKPQAASWAAKQFPEWAPLVNNALRAWREDWYEADVDPEATFPDTARFVNFAVDRIVGP
jgi:predicted nucleotidyltransferase